MNYRKHEYQTGEILYAAQLNAMEDQIAESERASGVSPETFGALGDGTHDDAPALKAALESGKPVFLSCDLYIKSKIWIRNRNVALYGNGHTIYVDGTNIQTGTPDAAFLISSDLVTSEAEQLSCECRMVSDADEMHLEIPDDSINYHNNYRRGYISYKGRNPTPTGEVYENSTISYWHEHHAIIRDLHFRCVNCEYLAILELRRMCFSEIRNVSTICEEGHDGACGIQIAACFSTTVTGCYSEGWCSARTAHVSSEGYGINATGDAITVSNCVLCNSKHDFAAGSARTFFDTGMVISDLVLYRKWYDGKRSDGSGRFMQQFDIHAASHCPIVSNINLICENAKNSVWHSSIRCPKVEVINFNISALGGKITASELAEEHHYTNLNMPTCVFAMSSGFSPMLKKVTVDGGDFQRIEECNNIALIELHHVTIREFIDGIRFLHMDDCRVLRDMDWIAKPTVTILGEALIRDSEIHGHWRESIQPPSVPLVKARAGRVRLQSCHLYKRIGDYQTFDNENEEVGCWTEDALGLITGTDKAVIGAFDLC